MSKKDQFEANVGSMFDEDMGTGETGTKKAKPTKKTASKKVQKRKVAKVRKDESANKVIREQVSVRVEVELAEEARNAAKDLGQLLGEFIEDALRSHLEKVEDQRVEAVRIQIKELQSRSKRRAK